MGLVQQQIGKKFETQLLQILKEKGYWATKLATRTTGTVFDILAVKDNRCIAFECKTVAKGDKLRYTKELQKKTDELNNYYRKNNKLYLAIRFEEEIKIVNWASALYSFETFGFLENYKCSLTLNDFLEKENDS